MTEENRPPKIIEDIVKATSTISGVLMKEGSPLPGTESIVTREVLETSLPAARNMQDVSRAWIQESASGAELWIEMEVPHTMVEMIRKRSSTRLRVAFQPPPPAPPGSVSIVEEIEVGNLSIVEEEK